MNKEPNFDKLPRDEEGNIIGTDMAKYGPGPVGERGPLGR